MAFARAVAILALFGIAAPAAQAPAETPAQLAVTAVRFWTQAASTRVAIEVSGEFEYRHDRLTNPDRLYFDIVGAKPKVGSRRRVVTVAVGDALIKQIRVSETQIGVTRVVMDLEQAADFTASQLANPDRLVVELRAKDKPAREETKKQPPAPSAELVPVAAPAKVAPTVSAATSVAAEPAREEIRKPPAELLPIAAPAKVEPAVQAKTAAIAKPAREETIPIVAPPPADVRVPLPAKKGNLGGRSLLRALGLKLERVVIDPGHGGHDTGTIGPSGLMEKDLVLDIAQRLGALIEEQLGAEVVYTRSDDTFVPLEERTALANEKKADLFLSIHANSGVASATGTETYYLNFTTSKSAMDVAARENASSQRTIHELQDLVEKIALKDKVEESREFAAKVQSSLVREMARVNTASRDRGVRKAPFVVLVGAAMPSVLTEIDFLSNSREEKLLKRFEYRQKIAEALLKGVSQYASTLSRFQLAEQKKP